MKVGCRLFYDILCKNSYTVFNQTLLGLLAWFAQTGRPQSLKKRPESSELGYPTFFEVTLLKQWALSTMNEGKDSSEGLRKLASVIFWWVAH